MMASDFIIDVTESDFEFEVIKFSFNAPVIVDFWATWCKPCQVLSPLLESLANEAKGAFRLAKVDVDPNPNLALRFSVRSIPTVKAFIQGKVVAEFVGVQPENRIREFLSKLLPPDETSLLLEKAESFLSAQDWSEAEKLFRNVLIERPEHPQATLGLIKSILAQGKSQEARLLLRNFPASPQYHQAEKLRPLSDALVDYDQNKLPDTTDLDIAYLACIRLARRGNFPAALDGLLDIIRQNRHYKNDKPRLVFLGILEILGEQDPQTRQYRSELASVLF
jgi:putative thioredoxin